MVEGFHISVYFGFDFDFENQYPITILCEIGMIMIEESVQNQQSMKPIRAKPRMAECWDSRTMQ